MGRARDERLHQLHRTEVNRKPVVLILSLLALSGCNGGTVDKHTLKRDAEKIGSLATEGGLLANDVAKGGSTKSFVRVHAEELSSAASDLAASLAKRPTSPGIEPDVRKLSKLAAKVSGPARQAAPPPDRPRSCAVTRAAAQRRCRRGGRALEVKDLQDCARDSRRDRRLRRHRRPRLQRRRPARRSAISSSGSS